MDLNHLHLRVHDIAASRRFYEKFFAFTRERLSENEGKFVILQNPEGFDLALAHDEEITPFPEWFHFGFRLKTADAVREMYQRFISKGSPFSEKLEEYDDYVTFRCKDPDGYTIEVYWE